MRVFDNNGGSAAVEIQRVLLYGVKLKRGCFAMFPK